MTNKQKCSQTDIVHNVKQAKLFLLFYLFETWEKLLQITAFVDSPEHRRKSRKQAIIKNYESALQSLARALESPADYYLALQGEKPFVYEEYVVNVISIRRVVHALLRIHRQLDLLAGEGKAESQITYDFVRKLTADTTRNPDNSWLPYVPSIALTGEYNFIEYDLLKILSNELELSGLAPLLPYGRDIVLALPKAEAENPLMWAILAHEVAHTMIAKYNILNEIVKRTDRYDEMSSQVREEYDLWAEEICADFIALRILGPSYYFSFASMAILLDPPQSDKTTHPSAVQRLGMMESIIKKHYPEWAIDRPLDYDSFSEESLIPMFLDSVDYKWALWTSEERLKNPQSNYFDGLAMDHPIVDKGLIFDVLDFVHVPTTYTVDQAPLSEIFAILSTGQPVSSWESPGFDKESFSEALSKASTADDIYRNLPSPEVPLTLSTILSSGWMLKVYHDYTELLELMKQMDSFSQTRESYAQIIHRRNRVLQTSLNRAFMMQMYWMWKEEVI